jgi:hypothetical protein
VHHDVDDVSDSAMQKEEVAQYDAQLTVERAARPERAGIHEALLSLARAPDLLAICESRWMTA